jgi:hypothetical protein
MITHITNGGHLDGITSHSIPYDTGEVSDALPTDALAAGTERCSVSHCLTCVAPMALSGRLHAFWSAAHAAPPRALVLALGLLAGRAPSS